MDGTSFYLPSLLDNSIAGRSTRKWNASATSRHSATSFFSSTDAKRHASLGA